MNQFSRQQIVKNFFLLCLGQYGGMACNMIFSIMLTRLLVPQDFGLLAMMLFYFIFFNWIVEWGWEQGFMAHKEIPLNRAASTHFFIRCFLGSVPLITFSLLYTCSSLSFVQNNIKLIIALALIYWCEKIGLTYRTILERTYRLNMLAGIEFFNIILSYAVAVTVALHGGGVWSLVAQRFVEKGFISFAYFCASPWKYGTEVDFNVARTFFKSFGLATWLGGIVSLTIYDFMPFLVGTLSSTYQAGLYAKAFSMATFPVMLTGIFNRLTVPLYTQYQGDVEQIKSIFVKTQTIKLFLLLPTQVLMAVTAHYWIPALIGDKWIPMVAVYQVMTLYGIVRAFFDDVPGILLYGFKQPWELTKNQMIQSVIIMLVAPPLVMWQQAYGGAIAMSIMLSVAAVLFWMKIFNYLSCSWLDFVRCIGEIPHYITHYVAVFSSRFVR